MASSLAHEDAWFDDRQAIFTGNLVAAMRSGVPTLYEAFLAAKSETTSEAAALCGASKTSPRGPCLPQEPILIDPFAIARQLKLK